MDTFDKIKEAIIKVQPGIDESKIALGARLQADLEIDSLGMVELALAMEEATGFYLPDDELEEIVTVGDAVSLIESKSKTKNGE